MDLRLRHAEPVLGASLLLALGLLARAKLVAGVGPELLWACHVASALGGVGLLLRSRRLVALAFLFHVAVGAPAYALEVAASRTTTWESALLHLLTPAATWVVARHGLPRRTWLAAWGLYLALLPLSFLTTPPGPNVNLAHGLWSPLFGAPGAAWVSWLVNGAAVGLALYLASRALRRWLPAAAPTVTPT